MAGLSRLITVFLFSFGISCGIIYAQVPVKKSDNKVIIEGKIYYLHAVKPGQTLYSITRAYEVSEKDIAIENPGVYSGLQVGQILKIPADVPKVKRKEEPIDTSKYITHALKTGETLYSLSRRYNVPVEEIEKANPDVDLRDLPVGMVILIPKLRTIYSQEDFILHTVRRKETIYRLTRKYNVSEEDIIKHNPELKWGELRTGQVIRIPKEEFLAARETEEITDIERTDTLEIDWEKEEEIDETAMIDSLGLEEMSIEDYYRDLKDFNNDRLNVAILIPFNYRIIPEDIDEDEEEKTEEEKKEEEEEENLPRSINFLEFFEGSLLALDSLKKEGIDLNVKYFDTYRSPTRVREILNTDFFRDVDLIIGPFFAYNVELLSEFSRKNRVPLISPFYDGEDLTKRNPYLFQVNPSYKTEYSRAAEILSRDYDKNFIFIYKQDSDKYHEIEFFKSSLLKDIDRFIHTENVVLKEISYENPAKEDLAKDFSHALTKDRRNIVIIPEQDQAFVSTVITQLYFQLRDYDIEVFGLPHFHEFEKSIYEYYHELSLSYLSPFHYDYDDEQIRGFLQKFSSHFKAEPRLATRKGCSYAFVGYDLTYYFIRNIAQWDNRFVSHLNAGIIDNLLPSFYFHRDSRYGGFENQTLKMVSFTKDYDVDSWDTELEIKPDLPDRIRRFWFDRND